MEALKIIASRTLVLPQAHIDTDQIIPARFLTTTSAQGLGRHAFADWRYHSDGSPRADNPLAEHDGGQDDTRILVAGRNFGCGSSREHAAWALRDYGFQAVLSVEIADIFRANALKNGLLAAEVDAHTHRWLLEHSGARLRIDVERTRIELPDGRHLGFELDEFSRYCLTEGLDQLGYLLSQQDVITAYEAEHA